MGEGVSIAVRNAGPEDEAFIHATWLHGLRHGNPLFGKTKKSSYYTHYQRVINVYLANAQVKVACLEEDPDVILGYSVVRGTSLDWVFVKKSWRRLGIAKKLIPSTITTVSHLTELGESIKPKEWQFDPFI